MIRSIFLLLSTLALTTSAYSCIGPNNQSAIISPPIQITKPLFYPQGWNDRLPIPKLDPNQGCLITVQIPKGYYITVNFHRHFPDNSGTYILYSNNDFVLLDNNDPDPYIFMYPYFKVSLQSDNSSVFQFAMEINYTPLPNPLKTVIPITKGQPPVAVSGNTNLTTFVANPNSLMSVMAFGLVELQMNFLYRQTAVFGGDSLTDTFVGTLDKVLSNQNPLIVNGNKISVYTFNISQYLKYPLFMGQDSQDVRQYRKYFGANCPSHEDCKVLIDGSFGHAMTVTDYNGSEFVKGFDSFPGSAVVNVYENSVTNTTRIASLTSANYLQQLPLEVKGVMKFYEIVGSGKFNMTVTRDVSRASRI